MKDYQLNWEKEKTVNIPHNWDSYEGYRRLLHGNLHGTAWYRKEFSLENQEAGKEFFLFFEGVGSYATVWLNGKKIGSHAGGRTTFTLNITNDIKTDGSTNRLLVKADHPAGIRDLPWVCGGCSDEWGFSEGSQPFGIFRPVSLIITGDTRVEPFGIHIWNDTTVKASAADLHLTAEVKNYSKETRFVQVKHSLLDQDGKTIAYSLRMDSLAAGELRVLDEIQIPVSNPRLWSPEDPYRYTLVTEISHKGKVLDRIETPYGIRWISWPIYRKDGDHRFYVNGEAVFINGTAEYEHMLGQSHSFSATQVEARVMQMKAAGFNAFRDAHQPHNLRYQHYWDSLGMLFWTQMGAHIWFDTPEFRENFKSLLRDWVKERRNSPSVILWGLQNESQLPTDFAEECTAIIREMDPTSPSQRLVTTCNGGTGTDWNVIQNWSGTYAGDLYAYDIDISKELLNGEYGAWRSIDLHTEGPFNQNGAYSEERMCQLMETKVRLAEQAKDSCCGQFQWIFNSHDNPGRTQNGEGLRELDRIGPVNYKGLITPWGEPLDVYYMYRANYADPNKEPMVYIVSHTWPNRWTHRGIKDSIVVYSNCEEVELFNALDGHSLGKKKKGEKGTHFQWDGVNVQYNILKAVGYQAGKAVAEDIIEVQNLPPPPSYSEIYELDEKLLKPREGYEYIYRYNCGGPAYTDSYSSTWHADVHLENENSFGSRSWTDHFEGLPPFLASQRRTFDPIVNTYDWKLFQNFRYGRDQLSFHFPVPDGSYLVELYFIEPWYGTGGGMDCEGWRVFDVAVNDQLLCDNLDIWSEAGHDRLLKKSMEVTITGGSLDIHFPEVLSGQALVSAIAIASKEKVNPALPSNNLVSTLELKHAGRKATARLSSWLDLGSLVYSDAQDTYHTLPPAFFGASYIQLPTAAATKKNFELHFTLTKETDVFVLLDERQESLPPWLKDFVKQELLIEVTGKENRKLRAYAKRFYPGEEILLGKNEGSMYSVVLCEVSDLGYAADQRPKTRYEAEDAEGLGNLKKGTFKNATYMEYTDSASSIQWEFEVGLGDTYTLDFRFLNNSGDSIPMQLYIEDSYGNFVWQEALLFESRIDSWRKLKTSTGTSINAGRYRLILKPIEKVGLCVDAMDVR